MAMLQNVRSRKLFIANEHRMTREIGEFTIHIAGSIKIDDMRLMRLHVSNPSCVCEVDVDKEQNNKKLLINKEIIHFIFNPQLAPVSNLDKSCRKATLSQQTD